MIPTGAKSTAPQYAAPTPYAPARWGLGSWPPVIAAALLLAPVGFVLASLFSGLGDVQQHIW
ncbi:MAG: hypothetical protein RIE56_07150, partial [Amphiplicatus sp.]